MSIESKINTPTTIGSNSGSLVNFKPGERVRHADLGEGVVIAAPVEGFIKVFFPSGERQVPVAGLTSALSRSETVVLKCEGRQQEGAASVALLPSSRAAVDGQR